MFEGYGLCCDICGHNMGYGCCLYPGDFNNDRCSVCIKAVKDATEQRNYLIRYEAERKRNIANK